MLADEYQVRAVLSKLGGLACDSRRPREERVHLAATERVRQRPPCRDSLQCDFSQIAAARLREYENVRHHSTLASFCSSRTSSGTAAAPCPTIRPGGRSGGSSMDFTLTRTGPSCAGLLSSGFFFAAMMPLSEG